MDEERRMRWYKKGLSDESIAAKCGVARVTITAWRLSRGLSVNRHHKGALTPQEHARRVKLWKQGLPDSVIADEIGVTTSAILHWRSKQGLAPHDYNEWRYAARRRLSRSGLSDAQIATRQGVTVSAVRKWRQLEASRRKKPKRASRTARRARKR